MIGIHGLIVAAFDLKTMPVGATNVEEKGIGNAVLSRSAFEIGKVAGGGHQIAQMKICSGVGTQ